MIFFWDKKEVAVTIRQEDQALIRKLLTAGGIDYSLKVSDLTGAGSLRSGGRGVAGSIRSDSVRQYIFYVRKRDFEKAKVLLQQR